MQIYENEINFSFSRFSDFTKVNFSQILDLYDATYIHKTYMYINTHTYMHMYVRTFIHTYTQTYLHTYIRTYIHTSIHTHTHTYTHTHTVYENERVALLSTTQNDSSFNNLNRFEKILYLCNNYPRQLAKFICRAYEHRQSLVFTL